MSLTELYNYSKRKKEVLVEAAEQLKVEPGILSLTRELLGRREDWSNILAKLPEPKKVGAAFSMKLHEDDPSELALAELSEYRLALHRWLSRLGSLDKNPSRLVQVLASVSPGVVMTNQAVLERSIALGTPFASINSVANTQRRLETTQVTGLERVDIKIPFLSKGLRIEERHFFIEADPLYLLRELLGRNLPQREIEMISEVASSADENQLNLVLQMVLSGMSHRGPEFFSAFLEWVQSYYRDRIGWKILWFLAQNEEGREWTFKDLAEEPVFEGFQARQIKSAQDTLRDKRGIQSTKPFRLSIETGSEYRAARRVHLLYEPSTKS